MNTLSNWNPYTDFDRLLRAFSRGSCDNGDCATLERADWSPAVDISEDETEYLIKADLPDISKDDVKVTVDNGTLVLRGERRQEKEEENKKFHRIERSYGSFLRTFVLPEDADQRTVSADFKEGVLYVHLPKNEEKQPKHIEVNVG
ncbi:MAG: Hsp20/alpha crystallin family protein [Verrucomicrobiales bacterium]|nr:Hsp20/alpha crystallin family protein [Verrucomicrobiota bacterium JB025]